jgi:hypothetical protein
MRRQRGSSSGGSQRYDAPCRGARLAHETKRPTVRSVSGLAGRTALKCTASSPTREPDSVAEPDLLAPAAIAGTYRLRTGWEVKWRGRPKRTHTLKHGLNCIIASPNI